MSANQLASEPSFTTDSNLDLEADVLVIGGGPAGAWAAYNAAASGARVILVDKGYCGSSGATASGGTSVWYVGNPEQRETAMASREALGGFLSERDWMERVLDLTHANLHQLGNWGYPFPSDQQGQPYYRSLQQGAEYMRLMRKQIKKAGVQILDHSPALELLVDQTGAVAGAKGIRRQAGGRWTVRAGAVVIATGGCAFLSKALGCNVLTGDGYLMAAEAGAEISSESSHTFNPQEVIQATQAEVLPYNRNLFRTEQGLSDSLERLHSLWREIRHSAAPTDSQTLAAREAAAMVATARWMYTSAQARTETRGMHKHQDYPQQDANQQYRLISGGLDKVWAKPEQEIVNKELVAL
ncbi:FAD-dependent oxidoreductase [Nostoc sp. PCC 7107]|uniref:FAD-dependent oxidoreductase n=1 Tax=Nostoc sp. PCC 7107 TaxID=317936 RepID=UPI00029EEDA3|nr:FAD-binding protein [Nostoc sp. PCC 7107]AFY45793.1 FAD dependent oxidoreductase [Nostoc sp. PCC 7107]